MYKTLAPPILKHVLSNSGTRDDGKDVFQETFIKVLKNLKEGKYNDNNRFEAYFIRIARNTWIDHLRERKRPGDLPPDPIDPDDGDLTGLLLKDSQLEALSIVWETWNDTDCQRRLKAFHFEDKSTKEIADTEGVEQNTLLQQLRRCRQKLFKLVSKQLESPTKK